MQISPARQGNAFQGKGEGKMATQSRNGDDERRQTDRSCKVCDRNALLGNAYCESHGAARTKLEDGFRDWQRAFVEITWERYLDRVLALRQTGAWVREVARYEANLHASRL